jgi:glycerol uptake facilitator-like aquaporin
MPLTRKLAAEFIGTFWLVLGGCGSAVLAAAFPHVGIGLVGVALAFGLTIVAMACAIGDVSGCHLNPAVTFGLVLGGRPVGFAPLAIGLTLTLIHLISIPVTNTSVNPARSTGPAVFVQGWAPSQLWLFWLAPLLGGAIGALVYRFITPGKGVTEPGY